MAATKRIFREWQHPRASNGRFAKKGSPAWAARAFKAAQAAGVGDFSMTHGGERQERMQPFSSFSAPKKAAPPTKAAAPKTAAPGARRTVAQDAQKAINAKAVNLDVQTSEKDIESRYGKASKAVAARKSAVDTPRDTTKTGGMPSTTTGKAAAKAPKKTQQQQLKDVAAEHGWELRPGRFPGTVTAVGSSEMITPDSLRLATRHSDNSGVLHRPTWDQDTYNSLRHIDFSIGENGKLSGAFLSEGTPWTGTRPRAVSIKKALEHIQANPRKDETTSGALHGSNTPGIRTMDALLEDLQQTGHGKTAVGYNGGHLDVHVRHVRNKLRGRELTDQEAAGKLGGIASELPPEERHGPIADKIRKFATHLRYGGDGRPEDLGPLGGKPKASKTGMEGVSDRIAEQRGLGGVAVPLDRKTRTGLSDRALKKADQMAAEQRGGIVEAPLSTDVPKVSDADFANRYGGAAKAVAARRSAASAGYTDPRDALLATRPGEGGQLGADILDKPGVDIRAVVDAIKAVPDSKNGATAYPDMDRTTLLALARIAGISGRGKSNAQIADALKAKDEARKMRLNPKGIGQRDEADVARPQVSPVAAAAAARATRPTAPGGQGYAADIANFDRGERRAHYMGLTDAQLKNEAEGMWPKIPTAGKSRAQIVDDLIARDVKSAGLTKVHGSESISDKGRGGSLDRFEFAKGAGPKA